MVSLLWPALPYIVVALVVAAATALALHSSALASTLGGLAGLGTLATGAFQLYRTARTQQAEFLFKLHESFFFREGTAKIRDAIDAEQLWVEIQGMTPEDPAYNPPRTKKGNDVIVTGDELDDYLGYLEIVALFLEADMLAIDMAWEMFSHYVELSMKDKIVLYYIDWINKHPQHTRRYYTRLQPLNEKFIRYARKKKLLIEKASQR